MTTAPLTSSQVKQVLDHAGSAGHILQFYETDRFLIDNVCHFAAAGIAGDDPVLVIATPAHRLALRDQLQGSGIDLDAAQARGLYTECDAQELLAEFMLGPALDPARFRDCVGSLVASTQARCPDGHLRAFSEMVDLLWQDGNRDGAVGLEELWNTMGQAHAFTLLCACGMSAFDASAGMPQLESVCSAHAFVLPTEEPSESDQSDDLRDLKALQRRTLALNDEIAQGKERERLLRDALDRATEACARAERTARYNDMFTGMLGHELRNPLNAILTTAQYLARTHVDSRTTTAVTRITVSSRKMARMIEQLLAFTRIRVGTGLLLQPSRVDLMDLCEGIKSELEAERPGCLIVMHARGVSTTEVDYQHMLDVLSNLIGNALDHGTPGRPVSVEVDGTFAAQVVLQVTNSGAVPPDVLPVMFEPFRGDAKGHRSQALGLGLYLTRQIVTAHGGELSVESSETAGTTFRIALPRAGTWTSN